MLPPLRAGLAWHQRGLGPAEELAGVLSLFEGRHDFRAFSAKRRDGRDETRDTVRTLHAAAVEDAGAETLVLRFSGDGFLYKMVRFLVGSAAWCLRGRVAREELAGLLERPGEHGAAPYCAPPDGLLLEEVRYPPEFAIPE